MRERIRVEKVSKTKVLSDESGRLCPRKILDDICMAANDGEVLAILGPTGCGKTTLLRLLIGLEVPDSGEIFIDGMNLKEWDILELRRKVGMVFQTPVLFNTTVEDDILFGRRLHGETDSSVAEELALRVGLSKEILARRAEGLSVGEKQKVTLARALANEPEILLLDEPSSAQDPSSRMNVERFIRKSAETGPTVVLVTHDVLQAERLADRVLLMINGRTVAQASKNEIFGRDAPDIVRRFLSGNLEESEKC